MIPACKDKHGHERVPRDFDKDAGLDKCLPRMRLRRTFSGFVEGALGHEVGHDLRAKVGE